MKYYYDFGILFLTKKKMLYNAQEAAIKRGENVKIALNIVSVNINNFYKN